jgi:hypothetical protein
MLKYWETNWKSEKGFETHRYEVIFNEVLSHSTVEEQKKRPERLSLVKFFDDKERNCFFDICCRFQKNDKHFYFDNNRKFHSTFLGFPVMQPEHYHAITEKIKQYSEETKLELNLKFDVIRPGTKYENNKTLKPIKRVSNGTIIAFGDSLQNRDFVTFANQLASFLLKDENLISILGNKFRRRFPTVWSTMGHYTTDFKISTELEKLFNEYKNLDSDFFQIPCAELEIGSSHYKDLRDWKRIERFSI